jgi:hypothetical protein
MAIQGREFGKEVGKAKTENKNGKNRNYINLREYPSPTGQPVIIERPE